LISLVERYGEKRWNMVANGLPGRTGKGCSHRCAAAAAAAATAQFVLQTLDLLIVALNIIAIQYTADSAASCAGGGRTCVQM
jgi:hypothetical protein